LCKSCARNITRRNRVSFLFFLCDFVLGIWFLYNTNTTILYMRVGPSMWDPPSCEGLLYWCCKSNIFLCVMVGLSRWFVLSLPLAWVMFPLWFYIRDLILVQHQYNMWDPPSCEGLLYSCCIGVVNLTFFFVLWWVSPVDLYYPSLWLWVMFPLWFYIPFHKGMQKKSREKNYARSHFSPWGMGY
jgi:hypothetical protein